LGRTDCCRQIMHILHIAKLMFVWDFGRRSATKYVETQ